jgi:hypothetical protein
MNSSNFSQSTNTTGQNTITSPDLAFFLDVYNFVHKIAFIYIVPAIAITGFCLNLLSLIVFLNPKLKGSIYKYLVTKSLAEIILQTLGATYPILFCSKCPTYLTLGWAILYEYGFNIVIDTIFTYSGLCEIAVVFERLALLSRSSRFDLDPLWVIAGMLALSFVPFIPILFSSYIYETAPGKYYFEYTEFGRSHTYAWYYGLISVIENVIVFAVLVLMNIALVNQFKKYLAKRKSLVSNRKSAQNIIALNENKPTNLTTQNINTISNQNPLRAPSVSNTPGRIDSGSQSAEEDLQKRITIMVIVLSFVFILSKVFQTVHTFLNSYYYYISITKPPVGYYMFDFTSNIVVYTTSTANFFIYIGFNKPFRECFIEMAKSVLRLR